LPEDYLGIGHEVVRVAFYAACRSLAGGTQVTTDSLATEARSGIAARAIFSLLLLGSLSACSHTVAMSRLPEVSALPQRIPGAVDVVIDPALRSSVVNTSAYAGVMKHSFQVPVGEALAEALQRAAEATFQSATPAASSGSSKPTLTLKLASPPRVNVQWQQGLLLVGQRTDCTLSLDARLTSADSRTLWQTSIVEQGQNETGRPVNVPSAGQAEPAVRQAIERLAAELMKRLSSAPEVALLFTASQ
jgi:hypothetical protein